MSERKIIEYRLWMHPDKGSDKVLRIKADAFAKSKSLISLYRKKFRCEDKLLCVYKESDKYYEALIEDLDKRSIDLICQIENDPNDIIDMFQGQDTIIDSL